MQPQISIIVPVYKVEKYLSQCIESVISQTYNNFELLLVNDGSPDNSGKICDKYADLDGRIKVFHKKNGGVSSARNVGLEKMKGNWVCFLDSDDWWEPTFLQNFVDIIEDNIYDIVLQGYIEENEIKGTRQIVSLPECSFNTASELIAFLEKTKGIHNGFLWHRLFRTDIFKDNNIKFPVGISFAEDGEVFFRYMLHASSSKIISKYGYHYRKVEGSLTSKGRNVSEDVFNYLIEAYTYCLSEIIHKENTLFIVDKELKQYMWRLLSAWQIERCILDYNTYQRRIQYIQMLITRSHLNQTNFMPMDLKILSAICMKRPSYFNLQLIRTIIKYRDIKQRIKNKL